MPPQPPPGRPGQPPQKPSSVVRPGAARPASPSSGVQKPASPAAPAARPSSVQKPAAAPAARPSSVQRPSETPQARPSGVTKPSQAPAARPSSVQKPAAAAPPAAPAARPSSIQKTRPAGAREAGEGGPGAAPAARPSSVRKPAPPPEPEPQEEDIAEGAPDEGTEEKKYLRPSKMQQALADAKNAPPPGPKQLTKGRLMFNLAIYLSIPASLAVIGYGVWKKKKAGKDATSGYKEIFAGDGKKDDGKPRVRDDQAILDALKKDYFDAGKLKIEQTKFAESPEKRKKLFEDSKALMETYCEKIQPLLEDPRYQGEGFGWMTDSYTIAIQVIKECRRELLAIEPQEEIKAGGPNTRALGILAAWKGTSEKFAVVFLSKENSPTSREIMSAEFSTGSVGSKVNLHAKPPNQMMELLQGTLREEVEKLEGDAEKAKLEELAAGISEFDCMKFEEENLSYATRIHGYFFNDQLAFIEVRLKDDRGVAAWDEYKNLVFGAYGTPTLGKEQTANFPHSHRLLWVGEDVVYELYAIGASSGMDLTLKAYNRKNWMALAERVGNSDPFKEKELEPYGEKPPEEPPKEEPPKEDPPKPEEPK